MKLLKIRVVKYLTKSLSVYGGLKAASHDSLLTT